MRGDIDLRIVALIAEKKAGTRYRLSERGLANPFQSASHFLYRTTTVVPGDTR